jgi:hypothetical protein
MIPAGWTERAVSERLADRRRETEHERHFRWGRVGNKARRPRSVRWHGWLARSRATRIRLPHRASWPGPLVFTQRGDRS